VAVSAAVLLFEARAAMDETGARDKGETRP